MDEHNYRALNGYKISFKEDKILLNGAIIMKAEYSHAILVDRLIKGVSKIEEGKITQKHIDFQLNGNTLLHMYALDADVLGLILDYLREKAPCYLDSILMKNDDGKTPLDIALENDSSRTADLFLQALVHIKEGTYSDKFYKKFPDLILKGIPSFHSYLATCTFQTVQMKNMKYLAMRSDVKDQLLIAHSSCVLDQEFLEKYTKIDNAQNYEYIRKRRELNEQLKKFERDRRRHARQEAHIRRLQRKTKRTNKQASVNDVQVELVSGEEREVNEEPDEESIPMSSSAAEVEESADSYYDDYESEEEESDYDEDASSYDDDETPDSYAESSEEESSEGEEFNPEFSEENKIVADRASKAISLNRRLNKSRKSKTHTLIRSLTQIQQQKMLEEQKEKELQTLNEAIKLEQKKQKEFIKEGLMRYHIRAIEFDWLFDNNYGKKFLYALSKTNSAKDDGLFNDLIASIIMFLWSYYRLQIIVQIMLPFIFYFVLFLFYATWISGEKEEEGGDYGSGYYDLNFVFIFFIILSLCWTGYFEIRKMLYYKIQYFRSFWNLVDIWSLGMNITAIVADLSGIDGDTLVPILAVAVLLMWLKLIYFGRIFLQTAWMVRMIYSVTSDTRYFLAVFGFMVLAFANSFYVLSRNGAPAFSGSNFGYSLAFTYQSGLGEFDTEEFGENRDQVLAYILWLMGTFIILIVMLNLLIAIVSDIFDKVHENMHNNLLKELTALMVETELLISREKLFKDKKYIIIIQREKGETGKVDTASKLSIMRHNMDKQVAKQKKILDKMTAKLYEYTSQRIDYHSTRIELSASKNLSKVYDSMDSHEQQINAYSQVFEKLMSIQA